MPREKTSKAVIKCARLNPINQEEAEALKIIGEKEKDGFNFKKVVVDAILFADGRTPEMFTRESQTDHLGHLLSDLFERFAEDLLKQIHNGRVHVSESPEEDAQRDDGLSAFARTFSRGVLQRQSMAIGDENGDE
jgi:hypothetical protein